MYRKVITAGLLSVAAVAVSAEPYVGIGYQAGASRVEQDSLRNPVVDGRTLDQSDHESAGSARLLAGYRFNDRWALESTFQRPTLETSIEETDVGTGDDEEWESSIESTHISLAPVYLHRLGERVELRFTAGLLYGDYDLERMHGIDVENGPDQQLSRVTASESKVGGIAGFGAAFTTPWKVELLAEALHQRTKILSNSSVSLSAVYRF